MKVSPEAAVVRPQGELDVALTYDLTPRTPPDFGKLARAFEVVLSVEVAGGPARPFLLTGTCRSRVATDTPVLHFGESNVLGRPPVSRWLTISADPDAATVQAVPDGDVVRVGLIERHGHNWRVRITPDLERARGPFETTLQVTASNAAGEVIGFCRVAVDGVAAEPPEHLWEGAHAP